MLLFWKYLFSVAVVPTFIIDDGYAPQRNHEIGNIPPVRKPYPVDKQVQLSTRSVRKISQFHVYNASEGVSIEYWYNETSSANNQHHSSPGCPQSIGGYPWVYYGSPPKCFLVGLKGPCHSGQKITRQKGSHYGICACNCFVEHETSHLSLPKYNSSRYIECPSPNKLSQVFDVEEEQCYVRHSQGPCPDETLISGWTNNSLICLPECDFNRDDWKEMEKKGLCVVIQWWDNRNAAVFLQPDSCEEEHRWSQILKRCIYQRVASRSAHVG